MSRTARFFPDKGLFHVLARGNNRAEIFHQSADYLAYAGILKDDLEEASIDLHHYCLMPNHVHLLVTAGPPATALSEFMHRVQLSYAIYHKARYGSSGHLWQGRFKSLWVDSDEYYFVCAAYIELNPVTAQLVSSPEGYSFSSYCQYALGRNNPCLTAHSLYEGLGSDPRQRQQAYRKIVEERRSHRTEDQMTVGFRPGLLGRPRKEKGTLLETSLFRGVDEADDA